MTAPKTSAFERILDAVGLFTGAPPRGGGRQYQARCPAHKDGHASLSITRGNERVLLKCHAGCTVDDILTKLGLVMGDLFDEPRANGHRPQEEWMPCGHGVAREYRYTNEDGELLFTVSRCPQKCFAQWRPDPTAKSGRRWSLGDARRVLYRLPAIIDAADNSEDLWVVEGEKDADRLASLGVPATCNPHGAGKWKDEYAEPLAGATITIVADKDEPGRVHAATIAASLRAANCTVRVVEAAVGKDVSDHLDAGKTLAELIESIEPEVEEEPPPTWAPVDLTAILAGTYAPEEPALMPRTDGHCLLYPRRVHSFHGESESGKSLTIQWVVAEILQGGQRAAYIDYESDVVAVVGRLLEMGVPAETIRNRFDYIQPEAPPGTPVEMPAWDTLLGQDYTLVVIDGVTDALGSEGIKSQDNDEVAGWVRRVPRRIARKTGAAVALVDHVTKDSDTRGRFAIGGQYKMAGLDGAAYTVDVAEALGRGLRGELVLRAAKDRPGGVRAHCGPFRKSDRTQEAARIIVDSRTTPGRIVVAITAPGDGPTPDAKQEEWRPSNMMEKISKQLSDSPDGMSLNQIRQNVPGGKNDTKDKAAAYLVQDGYATETKGKRNARMIHHVKLYVAPPAGEEGTPPPPRPTSPPHRPHIAPGEVAGGRDLAPKSPPPGRGGHDGARSRQPQHDPNRDDLARGEVPPNCPHCGFDYDSQGHLGTCET